MRWAYRKESQFGVFTERDSQLRSITFSQYELLTHCGEQCRRRDLGDDRCLDCPVAESLRKLSDRKMKIMDLVPRGAESS